MTNIDIFNERLHALRSLFDLALRHGLCDLARVAGKSSDEDVGESLFAVSLIEGLDDDGLLSGVSSGKDNNNLSSLCNRKIRIDESICVRCLSFSKTTVSFTPNRAIPGDGVGLKTNRSTPFAPHAHSLMTTTMLLLYLRLINCFVGVIDLLMIAMVANCISDVV